MTLVLDIGGTKIRIAEISKNKIKNKIITKTPSKKEDILKTLEKLIFEFKHHGKINISLAGFVKEGFILKTPNLDLNEINLSEHLRKKIKSKINISNDTSCGGLAEKKFGQGKNYKNFVYINLGTGIGSAIFIENKLYVGNGFAGEIGHTIINQEEYEKDSLKNNSPTKNYSKFIESLSLGILNLIYTLDPQIIILGGGISIHHPQIAKDITDYISQKDLIKRNTPIVNSKLGDDACLIGASLIK